MLVWSASCYTIILTWNWQCVNSDTKLYAQYLTCLDKHNLYPSILSSPITSRESHSLCEQTGEGVSICVSSLRIVSSSLTVTLGIAPATRLIVDVWRWKNQPRWAILHETMHGSTHITEKYWVTHYTYHVVYQTNNGWLIRKGSYTTRETIRWQVNNRPLRCL